MLDANEHCSVLLDAALSSLNIKPDGIYVDGTFGRGGHSRGILQQLSVNGRLFIIDKDIDAIAYAHHHFNDEPRVTVIHDSFANLMAITRKYNIHGHIDGVLLDLGVSSPQLDEAQRGFSFMKLGPLDMRMNILQDIDAANFINNASLDELFVVFKQYGEERYALRIAKAIIAARLEKPIVTTIEFANIIKSSHPKWEKHKHPATRVFQAVRIYVNQELQDLQKFLDTIIEQLNIGGRLAVISFHSLEDRMVKQFMRQQEQGPELPYEIPIRDIDKPLMQFKRIGKAIKPNGIEIQNNVRARSAVLRVGEKIL